MQNFENPRDSSGPLKLLPTPSDWAGEKWRRRLLIRIWKCSEGLPCGAREFIGRAGEASPARRGSNRLKFSGKLQPEILPHSTVTRVTFIEFIPAGRAVTLDQSRRVRLRTFDPSPPAPSLAGLFTPLSGPLSSYGHASAALFAYYRRAACRQQAIEIPLASPSPLRPLRHRRRPCLCPIVRQREKRVPRAATNKNFNTASTPRSAPPAPSPCYLLRWNCDIADSSSPTARQVHFENSLIARDTVRVRWEDWCRG